MYIQSSVHLVKSWRTWVFSFYASLCLYSLTFQRKKLDFFESTVITKLFVILRFYTQNIGKKEGSLWCIYSAQAIYIINNIIHFIGNQINKNDMIIQKILKIGQ